ncbi:MAG TPA: extracellular solute-binding protein [Acidimicrobiales bacterium]|nr:extracellular solute-binding protein [Acidimicrobiales bacterium]
MRRPARIAAALSSSLLLVSCDHLIVDPGAGRVSQRGTVQVLYAGSLVELMEQKVGPTFSAATGYRFAGIAGGSAQLAEEVKSGLQRADVFVSASPSIDLALEGTAQGNWVTWYLTFARAPLVLGYEARSRFAHALKVNPWYKVVAAPGFRVGRTDPALDPKGQLTIEAMREAAARTGDQTLLKLIAGSGNVFPEETLLGRLEAGQLDAGFLYLDEAKAAGLSTVSLSPVSLSTTFTVTVLARARNEAGALSFVHFLVGPEARRFLLSAGFELSSPPQVHGNLAPTSLVVTSARQ